MHDDRAPAVRPCGCVVIGSEAYAAAVTQTLARLAAIQTTPRPATAIVPDASKAAHYCRRCDLSWRGPAPCWGCGGAGAQHGELTANERQLWLLSNTSSGTFTEGEPCESF